MVLETKNEKKNKSNETYRVGTPDMHALIVHVFKSPHQQQHVDHNKIRKKKTT